MDNGKQKICKFFVVHNGSPAVLGMQDIDKLGLISVIYSTKCRQVTKEDSRDISESPRQTEGSKCEQFKGMKQEAETQNIQDTDNTNPKVTGNNNKELIADKRDSDSIDVLPELLNNQSLISGTEIEDDMMTIDMQINCDSFDCISESFISQHFVAVEEKKKDMTTQNVKINKNENESLILDIVIDVVMEAQTMQKKKRKQNKNKNKSNK